MINKFDTGYETSKVPVDKVECTQRADSDFGYSKCGQQLSGTSEIIRKQGPRSEGLRVSRKPVNQYWKRWKGRRLMAMERRHRSLHCWFRNAIKVQTATLLRPRWTEVGMPESATTMRPLEIERVVSSHFWLCKFESIEGGWVGGISSFPRDIRTFRPVGRQ